MSSVMSDIKTIKDKDIHKSENKDQKQPILQPIDGTNPLGSHSRGQSSEDKAPDSESMASQEEIEDNSEGQVISPSVVIRLLIPISVSMLLVIIYFKCVTDGQRGKARDHPLSEDRVGISIYFLPIIFMVWICLATFGLFLLFYYRFYKTLFAIVLTTLSMSLIYLSFIHFQHIIQWLNIAIDFITGLLFLWNFAILGMISIFWKAPIILQRSFLVINCSLVAIQLVTILPMWIFWALLVMLIIWDLIAVLCPFGPLRLLMNTYKKRQKEEKKVTFPPGLLYQTMIWTVISNTVISYDQKNDKASNDMTKDIPQEEGHDKSEGAVKERRPKLGLGDFVFYSMLMGKASTFDDINLLVGCYLGILVGLGVTAILLVLYGQALPALPISLVFGIIIFGVTYLCLTPFLNSLSFSLIFV